MPSTLSPTLKKLILSQLRSLLVVALVFSLGVGTTAIQVIAWATMLPTQLAQTGSISQAAENTFNGQFPCEMCKLAAIKRAQEQDQSPRPQKTKEIFKHVLICQEIVPPKVFPPALSGFPHPHDLLVPTTFESQPLTPPPQDTRA